MANAILTNNLTLAKEKYRGRLLTQMYLREPMLGILFAEKANKGDLRPNSFGLVGGGNLPMAERERLLGGYQDNIFWQTGTGATDQTANLSATDTMPSMTSPSTNSQAFLAKSAYFKWTKKVTQILVWNVTTELAAGEFAIANAKMRANEIGMQNHFDAIADEIYVGTPTSQTADVWSAQPGINDVCDDDNTYGGVDRSDAANIGWRGKRYTTSTASSVNLKNTLEIQLIGSYANSPLDVSTGFDTVIWNRTSYLNVRQQAEVLGQVHTVSSLPKFAEVGMKMEGFIKDDTINTYSPRLKDWAGLVDSAYPDFDQAALFTRSGDWLVLTNPAMGYFKETPWINLGLYTTGGNDAQQMFIQTGYQYRNRFAWNSVLATTLTS